MKKSFKGSSSNNSTFDEGFDSDNLEDNSFYEKKLHILHIPNIILWKLLNEGSIKFTDMILNG